jgi:hypothetical protein
MKKTTSMSSEQRDFLNLATSPARLTSDQAAWLIGCQNHEIPLLVAEGLPKPLGRPVQNSTKYFARTDVETCVRDSKWLNRATTIVQAHWKACHQRYVGSNGHSRNGLATNGAD